ncbi:uncharacterized protein LOC124144469 [Haliotis rufescens]|uniref:uncharacterized protein LOC124144469 n=1 Tax=Haliotis rufescens TaxID=6454 RepID=UPI00201F331F|nr:uncharacterized protein LOC124144469 [Haliotis rufescens]
MKAESVVIAFLSLFVAGTTAETCYGDYSNIYCMFGCCSDTFVIYCCLSNGAGIGIIIGVIIFFAAIAGLICRRRYVARTTYAQGSPGVSVVQTSTAQANMGYIQAPPPYTVAPKAY